jgi:TRAP-type mannitol/chloroaromatic compound transport system permease small subunit
VGKWRRRNKVSIMNKLALLATLPGFFVILYLNYKNTKEIIRAFRNPETRQIMFGVMKWGVKILIMMVIMLLFIWGINNL